MSTSIGTIVLACPESDVDTVVAERWTAIVSALLAIVGEIVSEVLDGLGGARSTLLELGRITDSTNLVETAKIVQKSMDRLETGVVCLREATETGVASLTGVVRLRVAAEATLTGLAAAQTEFIGVSRLDLLAAETRLGRLDKALCSTVLAEQRARVVMLRRMLGRLCTRLTDEKQRLAELMVRLR